MICTVLPLGSINSKTFVTRGSNWHRFLGLVRKGQALDSFLTSAVAVVCMVLPFGSINLLTQVTNGSN